MIKKYFPLLLLILASCNPLKKAVRTFDEHQEAAALYCAINFPAKDTFLKGDTVLVIDTLEMQGPVIEVQVPGDTIKIKGQCPPVKVITRTNTIHDTIIRVDKAKEITLQNQLADRDKTIGDRDKEITELKADNKKMKASRNKAWLWFFILLGAIGMYTVLRIKRIIPF